MTLQELKKCIKRGEDSSNQFKSDIRSPDALAAEIVSFLNAKGGTIYIGVDDNGRLPGLGAADVRRINQMLSNVASQHVRNPVSLLTENVLTEDSRCIILVHVEEGLDKPYFDNNGVIWLRKGADKRRVISKEEIRRFFEATVQIHADEQPTAAPLTRLDIERFGAFFGEVYHQTFPHAADERKRLLQNMNLALETGHLNLAGLLLFGVHPEFIVPQFGIKAISIDGDSFSATTYIDSEDFSGTLPDLYNGVIAFLRRNIRKIQTGSSINSPGESEIPDAVIEEILVNALVHRDYFVSAPVRVVLFSDRLEVTSPGALPNHLTVEKILTGNTNIRNPILASFVAKGLLPYRGLGSGIMRAKALCPSIQFVDDKPGCQFLVRIPRRAQATTPFARREAVLSMLEQEPSLPLRSLARRLGISLSALQGHVAALKAEGRLIRSGGTRGVWQVHRN